jgi:hypothetical protein
LESHFPDKDIEFVRASGNKKHRKKVGPPPLVTPPGRGKVAMRNVFSIKRLV